MRSWIFTPAFCKTELLRQCLKHLYSEPGNTEGFHHVVIYNHYPDRYSANVFDFKNLASLFGCIFIDSLYDRGLHDSLNNAMKIVGVQPGDIVIGCDPDDRPSHGAFQAMRQVMLATPKIAVLGLNFSVLPWKQGIEGAPWHESVIEGHRVWNHSGAEMFNIAAFNSTLLHEIGGFSQPNAYYGGIEIAMYQHWVRKGMRLAYLIDHTSEAVPVDRNDPLLFDGAYSQWKVAHATQGYKKGYADWLKDTKLVT